MKIEIKLIQQILKNSRIKIIKNQGRNKNRNN